MKLGRGPGYREGYMQRSNAVRVLPDKVMLIFMFWVPSEEALRNQTQRQS